MSGDPLRFFSYGGGVQSTAALVLAAQRRIDFPTFVMANVGDDSEDPATLLYVAEHAIPFAEQHGIDLHVVNKVKRDGSVETLWGRLMREESRSLPIPVRMSNGAPGTRSCTAEFKIRVTGKWAKEHGATAGQRCRKHRAADRLPEGEGNGCDGACTPAAPDHRCLDAHDCDHGPRRDCDACVQPNIATVGIGISLDEIHRANSRRTEPHERVVYPLISFGEDTGLRLDRASCQRIIREAGLPIPPKSSCFFCPFHRPSTWDDMARERPALFERACRLEDTLNERRRKLGKDPVFLTRFNRPLREIVKSNDHQLLPLLTDDPGCDSGWCMT